LKQKGLKFVILKIQTFFRKKIISGVLRYLTPMRVGFSQGHGISSSLRMQICFVQLQTKTTMNKEEDYE